MIIIIKESTRPSWICTEGSVKPAWQRLIRCRYQCLSLPPPPPPLHPQESDAEWICRLESWRGGKAHSWQAELLGKQHHAGAGRGGGGGRRPWKPFALSLWFVFLSFTRHCTPGRVGHPTVSTPRSRASLLTVPFRSITLGFFCLGLFCFVLFCFIIALYCSNQYAQYMLNVY